MFFFFFSSRRRHTRLTCDWSSDVCSSDLLHHANEEWMVVLRGRPTLRTPDEERELVEGDVACFPRGATGAHLVRNATEEPVRILMLSTLIVPDIVEYPDSSKFYALSAKGELIFRT